MKKITFYTNALRLMVALVFMGATFGASAQYIMTDGSNVAVTLASEASLTFEDSNSFGTTYSDGESSSLTVTPAPGELIAVAFSLLDVEDGWDEIVVSDGTTTTTFTEAQNTTATFIGAIDTPVLIEFMSDPWSTSGLGYFGTATSTIPLSDLVGCPANLDLTGTCSNIASYTNPTFDVIYPVYSTAASADLTIDNYDQPANLNEFTTSTATTLELSVIGNSPRTNGAIYEVLADGLLSFDYSINGGAADADWDQFGYSIDGGAFQSLHGLFTANENGSLEIPLTGGSTFTLLYDIVPTTVDGGTVTISNFVFNDQLLPYVDVITGVGAGAAVNPGAPTVVTLVGVYYLPDGTATTTATTCTFTITPDSYPDFDFFAHDAITMSLGSNGCGFVTDSMILIGDYSNYPCIDDYILTRSPAYNGACPSLANGVAVGCEDVGTTIEVTVTFPVTGLTTWCLVTVEDKTDPIIACLPAAHACTELDLYMNGNGSTNPNNVGHLDASTGNIPNIYNGDRPTMSDNCGIAGRSFVDNYVANGGACQDGVLYRTWTVTDDSGNTASCTQVITFLPLTQADYTAGPSEVRFECDSEAPFNFATADLPSLGGTPLVGQSGVTCNISWNYTDGADFPLCGESYKFVRTYTFMDMCTNTMWTDDVTILVIDEEAPVITCSTGAGVFTISTGGADCSAFFPGFPTVIEDCSTFTSSLSLVSSTELNGTAMPYVDYSTIGGYNLPIGFHTFKVLATDACGNTSDCEYTVRVLDQTTPAAVCVTYTDVTLTNVWGGLTRVYAETFDNGSNDNCAIDHFEVARMNTHCVDDAQVAWTVLDPMTFGPYVEFCCADIGGEPGNDFIQVIFRAYDINGNFTDCMVEVVVADKTGPSITCPPDVTINCEELDGYLSDLGQFGYVRTNSSQISAIYVAGAFVGFDGYAHDNCNTVLDSTTVFNLNECHIGTITRTWTVTDNVTGNASASCEQIITVEGGLSNFVVTFPNDVEITSCGDDSNYGFPVVTEDYCELVAIENHDLVYDIVPDACFKILREWEVINWCVYELAIDNDDDITLPYGNPNTLLDDIGIFHTDYSNKTHYLKRRDGGDGYMTYTQIIKVLDDEAPVLDCTFEDITSVGDVATTGYYEIPSYNTTCNATVTFVPGMSDACTDAAPQLPFPTMPLDLHHQLYQMVDGSWVNITNTTGLGGVGALENVTLDNGRYKVDYFLADGCGNTTSCWFEFRIVDKKNPTFYCGGPATVVMNAPGMECVTVWASEYSQDYADNCTATEDLVVAMFDMGGNGTFDGAILLPSNDDTDAGYNGWTYCCDDLGATGVGTFTAGIIVEDEAGNRELCTVQIVIQSGSNNCNLGPQGIAVAGGVYNENDAAVSNVDITANAGVVSTDVTGTNGTYSFPGITSGSDITIAPYSNDNPRNGVNTYDLVKIGRHVLETEVLDSPYKRIAADANHNSQITGADVVVLRQLILFNTDEIQNNTSWRFVDNAYAFTTNTPEGEDFAEVHTMNDVNTNMNGIDFTAVKIGDVTGDATPDGLGGVEVRDAGTITFDVDNAAFAAGEEVRIAFTSADLAKVLAYQFTLNFDVDALNFDRVEAGSLVDLSEANFGMSLLNEGVITTSWNGKSSTDEVLFTLVFTANTNATLNRVITLDSKVTAAAAYSDNGTYNVELAFNGNVATAGFELMQNEPNPFTASTKIGYSLPTSSDATLTIRDLTGRTIYTATETGVKGYNSFNVSNLATTGVLYYTVETAEFTATKKMVIVK